MSSIKHTRAVERLRNSCILALFGMAAAIGMMGYFTGNWTPPILILPFGQALILLWYLEVRLRVMGVEISDALDDLRRDVGANREAS